MVLIVLFAGTIWLNRAYIQDFLAVQRYVPSSSIKEIVDRSTMTPRATFVFYASSPEIDTASSFNAHCVRQEESSAILGCYANQRIYIYNVSDERLDGIQEVTASHEMLHAAWDRLGQRDKDRLAPLLEAAYTQVKTPELESRMKYYERTQPGERTNELHSIIGTEFAHLSDELEEYYDQYFTHRATLVGFHNAYQSIFTTMKERSTTLAAELDTLAAQTNSRITTYNADIEALNEAIQALSSRASTIDRSDGTAVNAYNTERSQLMARSKVLAATKDEINASIVSYNEKLAEYNQLAMQAQQLTESVDSTLTPSAAL